MQVMQRFAQLLKQNVGKVIVGKESAVELMMIAIPVSYTHLTLPTNSLV